MKEGYTIRIYKRRARWVGRKGYTTELSEVHPKVVVDFISTLHPNRIFWSWMPRNDDVVDIVKALLEEPHSEDFRNKLKEVVS